MRKIIFVFLFLVCNLFAIEQIDKGKLANIVNQIITINEQLQIVLEKDKNSTSPNSQYNNANSKIKKLLLQLQPLMAYGYHIYPPKTSYKIKIDKLKQMITQNQKRGYKNATLRDRLKIANLNASRIFFSTLHSIENVSKNAIIKNKFSSIIEDSLLSLRSITLPEIPNDSTRNSKRDYSLDDLISDKVKTKATIDTYVQILDYFHKNTNLLESNYIFSKLDIAYMISSINDLIPYNNKYLNFGKIIFCFLILGFFALLIILVNKRTFLIFVAQKNEKYNAETKNEIIKSTNRPLIGFLYVVGAKLCVSMAYYPYASSLFFSTLFSIAYTIVIAWFVIGISNGYGIAFVSKMAKEDSSFRKDVINLILKIFYFLVIVIAFLMILKDLGVNVSAIIASLGIGGLAVAWASKDILANFLASVLLLIDNSFSQGDWIVCGDIQGIVVEIGLRRTTIRTFDNALLFVPNSILASEPIRNWNRRKVGRRIKMNVGLTYDSPKDKIELCVNDIRQMLLNHPDIASPNDTSLTPKDYKLSFKQRIVPIQDLKGYKRNLFVYLNAFSASSIDILIYCFSQSTNWEDWLKTKEDVMLKIIDIVEFHGLSFAFPSQSLYVESMPKNELKDKLLENSK